AGCAAEIADLGSRFRDGGAQGVLDRHRCASLLLRPAEPLAAGNKREHESAPPSVLPEGHRPVRVLTSRSEPDRAATQPAAAKDAGLSLPSRGIPRDCCVDRLNPPPLSPSTEGAAGWEMLRADGW